MKRAAIAILVLALAAAPVAAQLVNNIAPTPPAADNSDRIATTGYVRGAFTAVRTVLTGPTTFFASPTGSGNCLTSGTPCTIQTAYNLIAGNYDVGGQAVTIQGAIGTYAPSSGVPCLNIASGWVGGGSLTLDLQSSGSSACNTTNADAVTVAAAIPGFLILKNYKCTTTTAGNCLTVEAAGATVLYQNNFGASAGVHVSVSAPGALAQCLGNYTISGGAINHWQAFGGGAIRCAGGPTGSPPACGTSSSLTITLSGTPAFTAQFAQASDSSAIYVPCVNFSGSGTGTRYLSNGASSIDTGVSGQNYIPGNAAGVTLNGGQYL